MNFFKSLLAFGMVVFGCFSATAQQRVNWVHLDNVSLAANDANDGDSFHARRNRSKYLLRLYFVDTPETDVRFPERLREQAAYFGVTEAQLLNGGRQAKEFTQKKLSAAPFDLYTKYRDARGASDKNRIFGMVKVEDRWLCELLVENGLARIHGMGDDLPDGIAERRYWSRLRTLENTAKRQERGLWSRDGTVRGSASENGQSACVSVGAGAGTSH